MKQFEKFYHGEKGNSQSDLNILSMTAHTFPKDYAKIFWQAALKWALTQETDLQFTEMTDAIKKELGDT